MRHRDVEVGQRVELRSVGQKGRMGTVRKTRGVRVAGIPVFHGIEVLCDQPNLLGARIMRVHARDLVEVE
jgi:hypothetical protein